MNRTMVKRIALLTTLCTLESTAGIVGMDLELPAAAIPGKAVYAAALSAEEAALQKAERDLIEAQYRVIAAQRALLEKQERQLKGSGEREPEPAKASAPAREPVTAREPAPAKVRPERRIEQPPVQQQQADVYREPRPVQKQEQVYTQPRPVQKQEVARPRQQVAQMPEKVSVSTPPPRNEGTGNQASRLSDEEKFTNAVWTENNGGVVEYKAPVPSAAAPQQQQQKQTAMPDKQPKDKQTSVKKETSAVKEAAKGKQTPSHTGKTAAAAQPSADIAALQKNNQGVLAKEEKMIYTTDQSVCFSFTGMTRKKSVDGVLDALRQVQGKGTFFVTEKELKRNADAVKAVADAGQEIGICIYPRPEEGFAEICGDILRVQQILKNQYGINTTLVKQFSGEIRDVTKEAVSATGCRLIGANMNAVQSRHKDYQSAEEILPEIMGPSVFSLGRGWIVNIRMDFYKKPDLAAELLLYLKRKKIDNIAYNSFDDVSGINPENDSAYRLRSISDVLAGTDKLWTYPVPKEDYVKGLERYPLLPPNASHEQLVDELSKRYFGEGTVSAEDRTIGFTEKDFEKLDMTGTVKTDDNVIFLTFDDWGHDSAINPLLYVLRKHDVPATFFILTHNVIYNPNLLRAIAEEGHDIASHTNMHKAMATENEKGKTVPTMGYEEYYNDVNTSYERLESIVGDLQWPDGRPVLTKFLRPPTLAISAMGTRAILENGFEYIINGSTSTADYSASTLETEIKRIRDGLYYRNTLRKGAIFVMHMTSAAKFTANALDVILTANEKKADSDPTKFKVGLLSDYVDNGYSQAKSAKEITREKRRIKWW
ncbi:MAG: polysaccharide deacetylase family protein [Acidaminococcaceae bacterium]|nr:polysaccharide deacetylase family protein [Acidaminococcaceae bacterium]